MIGKLTGRLGSASQDGMAVIEVGGVGYVVRTPLLALQFLQESGSEVSLFIHTAVREDAIDLYGFPVEEDLRFFKQLMSVSGIGPKTALSILNVADTRSLKRSIALGDSAALTKVFGIGKKSAERIIVELRDKIAQEVSIHPGAALDGSDGDAEVIEALLSLGYSAPEAREALKMIPIEAVGTRERLAVALKNLGSNAKSL